MTQRTRTNAHPGSRGSDFCKMSVDVPNALRARLSKLAQERKRGIGPLLCQLAEERINEIENEFGNLPQHVIAGLEKTRNEER